jgi:hypothetical protein
LTLGNGVLGSISTKQKVNSRSLTEAENIAVDDVIGKHIMDQIVSGKSRPENCNGI